MRCLYDSFESKSRGLETLGVFRVKYATILHPFIKSSLTDDILVAWERYKSSHRRLSYRCIDLEWKVVKYPDTYLKKDNETGSKMDLDNLIEFLKDEVVAEKKISLANKRFG